MHIAVAGAMALGVFVFAVGLGAAVVNHLEALAVIESGVAGSEEYLEVLNDRTTAGIVVASAGAATVVFSALIDENHRQRERAKRRGFFY